MSSLKVQINKTRTNFIRIYKVNRSLVQSPYLLSLPWYKEKCIEHSLLAIVNQI